MPSTLIDAATMLEAQRQARELGGDDTTLRLASAGIDVGAAEREAALAADLFESTGAPLRPCIMAAFLGGLELGARCARLVP